MSRPAKTVPGNMRLNGLADAARRDFGRVETAMKRAALARKRYLDAMDAASVAYHSWRAEHIQPLQRASKVSAIEFAYFRLGHERLQELVVGMSIEELKGNRNTVREALETELSASLAADYNELFTWLYADLEQLEAKAKARATPKPTPKRRAKAA